MRALDYLLSNRRRRGRRRRRRRRMSALADLLSNILTSHNQRAAQSEHLTRKCGLSKEKAEFENIQQKLNYLSSLSYLLFVVKTGC